MKKSKGKFIVIEGIDGSGKTTQFNLLVKKLKKYKIKIKTFDFPQYEKLSSYFIREYLNGKYGSWKEVGPYRASIFYALDRFDVGMQIKKWIKKGFVIISNRYTASNLGHQGAKIQDKKTRQNFFKWLIDFEHNLLQIPKPDINIILYLKASIAQKLIEKKGRREYIGGAKKDIHEADLAYLKYAEKTYLELEKFYPKDFKLVECFKNKLLTPEEIHQKVWKIVKNLLKIR
jgi:dTMP kinase